MKKHGALCSVLLLLFGDADKAKNLETVKVMKLFHLETASIYIVIEIGVGIQGGSNGKTDHVPSFVKICLPHDDLARAIQDRICKAFGNIDVIIHGLSSP